MPVTRIADDAARRIAVEQVVTSAVDVVKELVENAIDAGATSVQVVVQRAGLDSVAVKDNGSGVAVLDCAFLGRRHHTSKLPGGSFEAIDSVSTLGFRGEALSAIAGLAGSVSITTKTPDEPVARVYELDRFAFGHVRTHTASAQRHRHPGRSGGAPKLTGRTSFSGSGTHVAVKQLFMNLPVRRQQALKLNNLAATVRRVHEVLQTYALAFPAVRFSLSAKVPAGSSSSTASNSVSAAGKRGWAAPQVAGRKKQHLESTPSMQDLQASQTSSSPPSTPLAGTFHGKGANGGGRASGVSSMGGTSCIEWTRPSCSTLDKAVTMHFGVAIAKHLQRVQIESEPLTDEDSWEGDGNEDIGRTQDVDNVVTPRRAISITAYLPRPSAEASSVLKSSSHSACYFYVNNRPVGISEQPFKSMVAALRQRFVHAVTATVITGNSSSSNSDEHIRTMERKFPVCVVLVSIQGGGVDPNCEPNKSVVFIKDHDKVTELFSVALEQVFGGLIAFGLASQRIAKRTSQRVGEEGDKVGQHEATALGRPETPTESSPDAHMADTKSSNSQKSSSESTLALTSPPSLQKAPATIPGDSDRDTEDTIISMEQVHATQVNSSVDFDLVHRELSADTAQEDNSRPEAVQTSRPSKDQVAPLQDDSTRTPVQPRSLVDSQSGADDIIRDEQFVDMLANLDSDDMERGLSKSQAALSANSGSMNDSFVSVQAAQTTPQARTAWSKGHGLLQGPGPTVVAAPCSGSSAVQSTLFSVSSDCTPHRRHRDGAKEPRGRLNGHNSGGQASIIQFLSSPRHLQHEGRKQMQSNSPNADAESATTSSMDTRVLQTATDAQRVRGTPEHTRGEQGMASRPALSQISGAPIVSNVRSRLFSERQRDDEKQQQQPSNIDLPQKKLKLSLRGKDEDAEAALAFQFFHARYDTLDDVESVQVVTESGDSLATRYADFCTHRRMHFGKSRRYAGPVQVVGMLPLLPGGGVRPKVVVRVHSALFVVCITRAHSAIIYKTLMETFTLPSPRLAESVVVGADDGVRPEALGWFLAAARAEDACATETDEDTRYPVNKQWVHECGFEIWIRWYPHNSTALVEFMMIPHALSEALGDEGFTASIASQYINLVYGRVERALKRDASGGDADRLPLSIFRPPQVESFFKRQASRLASKKVEALANSTASFSSPLSSSPDVGKQVAQACGRLFGPMVRGTRPLPSEPGDVILGIDNGACAYLLHADMWSAFRTHGEAYANVDE